jgi:hypothetical protein
MEAVSSIPSQKTCRAVVTRDPFGHVARMWENRNACRLLVEKPERKMPLGTPKCWRLDTIKKDLGETGWDWSGSGLGHLEGL